VNKHFSNKKGAEFRAFYYASNAKRYQAGEKRSERGEAGAEERKRTA
jgi:hypothetical protein